MVFSSIIFLFFFLPISIIGYYCVFNKSVKMKNRWLLACSLFFYAWGGLGHAALMILSIFINWLVAFLMLKRPAAKKWLLITGLLYNILIIFVFKYLGFFAGILSGIVGTDINVPAIALPIGISFFTFQSMSYLIDIYRGNGEAFQNPLDVGLYIALFPQLIAGPIVRFNTICSQIKNRTESVDLFFSGIKRFVYGLGKKAVIANTVAIVAKYAFEGHYEDSIGFAWLGAIAYTLQIYFDFSGYSDMAIGLGRMFGFSFMENFNVPYIASSVSEFWRRWHISMGTWFRDYVYFPLGGSRKGSGRTLINLTIVWLLTGLWHGANWTFVVWGLLHLSVLIVEKFVFGHNKMAVHHGVIQVFKHVYTLFFVIIGWVLFNSNSLSDGFMYIKSMFDFSLPLWDSFGLVIAKEYVMVMGLAVLAIVFESRKRQVVSVIFPKRSDEVVCLFLTFAVSMCYIIKGSYNPFIYFNF